VSLLLVASCATQNPTEPNPSNTSANSTTIDEFYTPGPNGSADDYYLMTDGEDDIEYSYFIDEQDYLKARDMDDEHDGDEHYVFISKLVKRGHGYGDHNHIHIHLKGPHHYHGHYIGVRRVDWTDSLALTDSQKVRIDTAMRNFKLCVKPLLDSFKVQMKPYRDSFKVQRRAIIAQLDSGSISRDSARALLDSAIVKYEAITEQMRKGLTEDLKDCRTDFDAAIQLILTPAQYDIWVRHCGW
jgi:hypothetical protein